MIKKVLVSSAIAASIIMTGCGGEGSSPDSSGVETTVSGTVADGYLVGAKICLDIDNSSSCDTDEPSTVTTAGGKFNLTAHNASKYPLFVEVGANTIDEDDNLAVGTPYTMSAAAGETFVSPISTMVHSKMQDGATLAEARAATATSLGITNSELVYADYMTHASDEAGDVHKKAQLIAGVKMQLSGALTTSQIESVSNQDYQQYLNDQLQEQLASIKTAVDSNVADADTLIANIMSSIDLSSFGGNTEETPNQEEPTLSDEIATLTNSGLIAQNQKYSYTYNGGTDIKSFTIHDSSNKSCTFHALGTTSTYNPYSGSYLIDGDEEPTLKTLDVKTTDTSFTLSWMYYTGEGSHVDFYVDCETYVAPVVVEPEVISDQEIADAFIQRYEFKLAGEVSKVVYDSEIFFKSISTPKANSENIVLTYHNRVNEILKDDWAGIAITVNGISIATIEYLPNDGQPDVESIETRYDEDTQILTVDFLDEDGNMITNDEIGDFEKPERFTVSYVIARKKGTEVTFDMDTTTNSNQ